MSYRLLLDLEVVEFIAALPRRVQIRLRRRLGELQSSPERAVELIGEADTRLPVELRALPHA